MNYYMKCNLKNTNSLNLDVLIIAFYFYLFCNAALPIEIQVSQFRLSLWK